MINYCFNNINVYLLSTSMYCTYRDLKILEEDNYRKKNIDSLIHSGTIKFIDFEKSSKFVLRNFNNDDHLNPRGAKKLSILLDSILNHSN